MWKLLVVSFLVVSCSAPPDIPACRHLDLKRETKVVEGIGKITVDRPNPVCNRQIKEPTCGYCTYTVSDKEQYVGENAKTLLHKKPWSQIKRQGVIIPAEDYAAVKAFILDMCKKTNECSKDIEHWRIKLDSLDSVGDALGNQGD